MNRRKSRPHTSGRVSSAQPTVGSVNWETRARRFASEFTETQRDELAKALGVNPSALTAIGVGWDSKRGVFTFTEWDGNHTVIGIGTRAVDGSKCFVQGGYRGLTIPDEFAARPEPVLIVEGPSDVAAALTVGLTAVGRPSNVGGCEHLAKALRTRSVIVLGENDKKPDGSWPGRDGAIAVAQFLAKNWERNVSWALPPTEFKDIRAWLNAQAVNLLDVVQCRAVGASMLQQLQETVTSVSDECEVDENTRIVRPELFHTEAVSGVAVPRRRLSDGTPRGQWSLILHWHATGKREQRELSDTVELPDGTKLWLYPKPAEPLPTQSASWTANHRRAWVDGAQAPNGADLFKRICELIAHFLDFPKDVAAGVTATLTCWVLLTYVYPAWSCVPYLAVGGPLGSGKSTLFRVLGLLCFRPIESSNMTAACLFRTLHELGGTLLLDEAERLRESAPEAGELRTILQSGYKRGSPAYRMERNGDCFRRQLFDVYCPKALAAINALPEALASRCIYIGMLRAENTSPKPRRRLEERADDFAQVRDSLHALALEHGRVWLNLARRADLCPVSFGGRDFELWQPIFAIAHWFERQGALGASGVVAEFAQRAVNENRAENVPEADEILLQIVADHVRAGTARTLRAGGVLVEARNRESAIFGTCERSAWTERRVGSVLARYGLQTTKGTGSTGRVYSGVSLRDLEQLQRRYGIDLGVPQDNVPQRNACTAE